MSDVTPLPGSSRPQGNSAEEERPRPHSLIPGQDEVSNRGELRTGGCTQELIQ